MKGEVAASAVAIASLAREGFRPAGDLIFVAAADEEVGGGFGLQWLIQEHPDAVRAEYSVNEGAGDRLDLGGRVFYVCGAAEKMTSPFTLRVHGRSGHASMPRIADNALVKAARAHPAARRAAGGAAARARSGRLPRGGDRRGAGRGRGARPARRRRPAGGRDGRAAAHVHGLADHDRGLEAAERDPGALRGDGRLPHASRPVAGRGRGRGAGMPGRRRLRPRVARGAGRDALADRTRRSGMPSVVRRAGGAGRAGGAADRPRLHRQPLGARCVRHGLVRLLPDPRRWSRDGGAARSTPPTSASPWTTSSSGCGSCGTPR